MDIENCGDSTSECVELRVTGPFGWFRGNDVPCVFDASDAQTFGIYL